MAETASPREQIAFICSPVIKKQFFEQFFSVSGIEFGRDEKACNEQLWDRMVELSNRHDKRYDRLCVTLNTIDLFGANSKQSREISSLIQSYKELDEVFLFSNEFNPGQKTAREIAAWIYVRAHVGDNSPVKNQARLVWQHIEAQIAVLQQQSKTFTFFLEPDLVYPDDIGKLFESKYQEMRRIETGNREYAAQCVHDKWSNYHRFTITTEKDRTLALLRSKEGGEPFKVGDDPTAENFCIYFFPVHEYIIIKSYGNRKRCREIAAMFAKLCGTKLTESSGTRCFIQSFTSRDALSRLKLNDTSGKHKVWISALGIVRHDKNHQVVSKTMELDYPYSDTHNIYDNIERQYPSTSKNYSIADVFKVEVSFQFTDFTTQEGKDLYYDKPMKPIKVVVQPKSCPHRKATQHLRPEFRAMVEDCLRNANLLPLTKEAFNLLNKNA